MNNHYSSSHAAAALLLALAAAQAHGDGVSPSATPIATVTVSEIKEPFSISFQALFAAQQAFERGRQSVPGSTLEYRLLPRSEWDATPLKTTLESGPGGTASTLPVSANLTFRAPTLQGEPPSASRLVVNRKKERIEWWPHIRAVQGEDRTIRLGTLRLECAVYWAALRADLPLVLRGLAAGADVCSSARAQVEAPAPRRLRMATVDANGVTWRLALRNNGWSYIAPLADAGLSDDSVIEFAFAGDDGPPPPTRVSIGFGMRKQPSTLVRIEPPSGAATAPAQ